MTKQNVSNPFSRDETATQADVQQPIQRARVIDVDKHPDTGYHKVDVVTHTEASPYTAHVLAPVIGCVWVPKEGQDVQVMFDAAEQPWVLGAWYPRDRVDEGSFIELPDYEPGDIRLGNDSGSHVTVYDDGVIDIKTDGQQEVNIDHQTALLHLSSDYTITTTDNYEQLPFDLIDDDGEGLKDGNGFTVKAGGFHRIQLDIEIEAGGQGNLYTAAVFVNGVEEKRKIIQSTQNAPVSVDVNTLKDLNKGDTVTAQVKKDGSSDRIVTSNQAATAFHIQRSGI